MYLAALGLALFQPENYLYYNRRTAFFIDCKYNMYEDRY
jgi:hypothetical protein